MVRAISSQSSCLAMYLQEFLSHICVKLYTLRPTQLVFSLALHIIYCSAIDMVFVTNNGIFFYLGATLYMLLQSKLMSQLTILEQQQL